MYVDQIKIENYSGFEDSGWIKLHPRFNVVVGTNNSGKSSFLRALSGSIENNPHKSPEKFLPGHLAPQQVLLDIATSSSEFLDRLAAYGSAVQMVMGGPSVADQEQLKAQLMDAGQFNLKCIVRPGHQAQIRETAFPPQQPQYSQIANVGMQNGELIVQSQGAGSNDNSSNIYYGSSDNSTFHFPAERYHRAIVGYGRHNQLSGDGTNLAGFLQFLQGNDFSKFEEILYRLTQVIPNIERITVDTQEQGFNLLVWPTGSRSNRQLAFSLETCGTGVSQILAIFAAVVTKRNSCIIVDEVNSFLHPLAVKDLMSILSSEYPTNQYILSSHSSDVIAHPSVEQVVLVERDGFDSKVRTLDRGDITSLKGVMRQLGISVTDVLGAESLLWVEGPTESIAFPNLIRDHLGGVPDGLQIVSVSATGDFEGSGRDKQGIQRIYDRFMSVALPLAKGQCFLFDRESLSENSVADFETTTSGKLRFLRRRCLENYIISPKYIARMLEDDNQYVDPISEARVEEAIIHAAKIPEIRGSRIFKGDIFDSRWLREADGARILKNAFSALSDNKYEFRKTIHTPILLTKLPKEMLTEILEMLSERLKFLT